MIEKGRGEDWFRCNENFKKRMANMHARVMDMITAGFDHWIGVSWIGVSTTDLT